MRSIDAIPLSVFGEVFVVLCSLTLQNFLNHADATAFGIVTDHHDYRLLKWFIFNLIITCFLAKNKTCVRKMNKNSIIISNK